MANVGQVRRDGLELTWLWEIKVSVEVRPAQIA
jgi:hypothetical protein